MPDLIHRIVAHNMLTVVWTAFMLAACLADMAFAEGSLRKWIRRRRSVIADRPGFAVETPDDREPEA